MLSDFTSFRQPARGWEAVGLEAQIGGLIEEEVGSFVGKLERELCQGAVVVQLDQKVTYYVGPLAKEHSMGFVQEAIKEMGRLLQNRPKKTVVDMMFVEQRGGDLVAFYNYTHIREGVEDINCCKKQSYFETEGPIEEVEGKILAHLSPLGEIAESIKARVLSYSG